MSDTTKIISVKKRFFLSPLRLIDWIDNHESETTRRIFQGIIIIGIGSFATLIYQQRETLKTWLFSNSKSFLTFLQLPVQLQVWLILLAILGGFAGLWIFYSGNKKNKLPDFIDEIKAQEKIRPKTFPLPPIRSDLRTSDEELSQSTKTKKNVRTEFEPAVIERRREIINSINEKLIGLKLSVDNLTLQKNPESNKQQLLDRYWYLTEGFNSYFEHNKIYIHDVADKIEAYRILLQACLLQFQQAMLDSTRPRQDSERGHLFDNYYETTRQAELKHKQLLEDFREILGVSDISPVTPVKKEHDLVITAKLEIEHTDNIHFLLTIKVLNRGEKDAKIRRIVVFLTPDKNQRFMTSSELIVGQKQPIVKIEGNDGMHEWQQVLRKMPPFLTRLGYNTKFGRGYVELTSEDQISFEFELIPDEEFPFGKSK
jgi:hypothetical protein